MGIVTGKEHQLSKRIGQIIFVVNLTLVLAGLVLLIIRDIGPPSSDIAGIWVFWPLSALVYSVLALLIVSRQSHHVVGWLFFLTGFFTAFAVLGFGIYDLETQIRPGALRSMLSFFGELAWIFAIIIPIILVPQFFPNGRLPSKRWWPVSLAAIIWIVDISSDYLPEGFELTTSEILSDLWNVLSFFAFPLAVFGTLAAVMVRYFRSSGTERTQLKWLVYTLVVGLLTGSALLLLFEDDENPIISSFFTALPTLIAASIGVAILRYRLYDIDIIIRRTLQYGLLTAILILIYFGLIIVFQNLFVAVGGQQPAIIIVISTLAVAALFNPLRISIQNAIDRRFFRKKYNAEQALAQFAAVARDEVDLDRLTDELLDVVKQTIQPESLGITLFIDEG